MKKMHFSDLECNPNYTAFSAPGLTMHQAAAALAFYYFCFQISKLLSKQSSKARIDISVQFVDKETELLVRQLACQ